MVGKSVFTLCVGGGGRGGVSPDAALSLTEPDWEPHAPRPRMQDYLPPALHTPFLAAVTEFVWLPWREAMRGCVLDGASQGGSQAARDAAQAAEAQAEWLRQALPGRFTERLLKQARLGRRE